MKNGIKQVLIQGMFFEDMGITYLGPVDGHNIPAMLKTFKEAARVDGAVVVHVLTKKGKGYKPAERHPDRFHGTEAFVVESGAPLSKKSKPSYTDVFSKAIYQLGSLDSKVVAITAAMKDGTGLDKFAQSFPKRFFDVGIAEEHGVTFAAGLAAAGLKPVVAIYSTFLQRSYDQILHDVCIQDLPVTFAIDRAGLVGSDGETHQGIFDLSYLTSIPNMTVMAPKNKRELTDMMTFAIDFNHPIALRYPRGEAYEGLGQFRKPIEYGKSEILYKEEGIALLAVGSMVKTAEQVWEQLKEMGHSASLVNVRFVKPMDMDMLDSVAAGHKLIVTLEENAQNGGFGEHVLRYLNQKSDFSEGKLRLINVSIPDQYVEHGSVEILQKDLGIDSQSVLERILAEYKEIS
jgi:1-deoxy-D-xylulose-5-phosphate synthase